MTVRLLALLLVRHWMRRRGQDLVRVALDEVEPTTRERTDALELVVADLDNLDRSPDDHFVLLYATPRPARSAPRPAATD